MRFCGVIVAAGSGARAGQGAAKQWRILGGRPVVRWSAEALLNAGASPLVVVVPPGDEATAAEALAGLDGCIAIPGGATRTQSVQAGLKALSDAPGGAPGGAVPDAIVLIHDAARPFVTARHVEGLIEALDGADGALPALPVSDTLKREDDGATVPRDRLWRAQTPQAFRLGPLREAFVAWPADAEPPTDDAVVVERAGGRVALIQGDPVLMKLTYPEDFAMAELIARALADPVQVVGQGFDAHRFGTGDSVWLCGVRIPHSHGLIGHSDADAGLHALTDALLGAVSAGDIGDHFPPSDPKWKGADSSAFLAHALGLVREAGGEVVNVDVTLICERPKLSPHRQAMRERLAGLLGLPLARVSVKATTTEGMGFTGREEGLAAQALAQVRLRAG